MSEGVMRVSGGAGGERKGRFEELLKAAEHSPKDWRDAVVAVADSAFLCRAWLEDHVPGWTPADLIAMTRLVMEREKTGNAAS